MRNVGCLVNIAAFLIFCLGGSGMKVDIDGEVKKKGNFRFCISSDAWSVYLCFRHL